MSNEKKASGDVFVVTKRNLEVYFVTGAADAVEAKKSYTDGGGVLVQSNETITVAPRSDAQAQTTPDKSGK